MVCKKIKNVIYSLFLIYIEIIQTDMDKLEKEAIYYCNGLRIFYENENWFWCKDLLKKDMFFPKLPLQDLYNMNFRVIFDPIDRDVLQMVHFQYGIFVFINLSLQIIQLVHRGKIYGETHFSKPIIHIVEKSLHNHGLTYNGRLNEKCTFLYDSYHPMPQIAPKIQPKDGFIYIVECEGIEEGIQEFTKKIKELYVSTH